MAAELYIISGYGLCKITIDGSDYFFDVIDYKMIPTEVKFRDKNIFGNWKNEVKGYYLNWEMVLGNLIPNTDVSPNILKTQSNIYNFLNTYHAMTDTEKSFQLVPAYGTEDDFEETLNRTIFNVIAEELPRPEAYKTNRLIGQKLLLKAMTINRIGVSDYQYFYRNTADGTWNNVGDTELANVRHSGVDEQLTFRTGGADEDAAFKWGQHIIP